MPDHTPIRTYRECAQALAGLPTVVAVDVLASDPRTGSPAVEIVADAGRAPPQILRTLAEYDLAIHDVARRGTPIHTTVIAV